MLAAAKAEVVAGRLTANSALAACTVATRTVGTKLRRYSACQRARSCGRRAPPPPANVPATSAAATPGRIAEARASTLSWDLLEDPPFGGPAGAQPANRQGTTSRVVGVANSSPPMTARARAAFCSSPAPPIAIGIMPTIIAAAVISTGRIRVWPAAIAASRASCRPGCCSRAKVTSRIEFAEATPTAMIAPISEGTLSVVPVANSMVTMPQKVAGRASSTTSGSPKFW